MNYRIGYSSPAGTADIFTDISEHDINVLCSGDQDFPIDDETVKALLPDLYTRILSECQAQEDSCIEVGIYNVEEYEDLSPEDFIVDTFYIFDNQD